MLGNEHGSFTTSMEGVKRELSEVRKGAAGVMTTAGRDLKTATDAVTTLLRSAKEDREELQQCITEFRAVLKELKEERKELKEERNRQVSQWCVCHW